MKKRNGQWVYDLVVMTVNGEKAVEVANTTMREARVDMRKWLDDHNTAYGSIVAYRNGTAILISGIRDSKHKHSPVATATIG